MSRSPVRTGSPSWPSRSRNRQPPPFKISTRSARFRRSVMCRTTCMRGPSARTATGRPKTSMQIEVVPTWPLAEHDVLILVMAAGVNYNGVWAGARHARFAHRRSQVSLSHRGLRCVRHRLGGRLQGEALESRRRSRRPLQSGRWRRRGMQWRRSDVLAVPAHLGLRDAGRLFRAIRPRAGPPADGAAEASHLGRIRLLHADARHDLSHVLRPRAAHSAPRP